MFMQPFLYMKQESIKRNHRIQIYQLTMHLISKAKVRTQADKVSLIKEEIILTDHETEGDGIIETTNQNVKYVRNLIILQ